MQKSTKIENLFFIIEQSPGAASICLKEPEDGPNLMKVIW